MANPPERSRLCGEIGIGVFLEFCEVMFFYIFHADQAIILLLRIYFTIPSSTRDMDYSPRESKSIYDEPQLDRSLGEKG